MRARVHGAARKGPVSPWTSGEPRSGSLKFFGPLRLLTGLAVLFDAYRDAIGGARVRHTHALARLGQR